MASESRTTILAALGANAVITVAKLAGGLLSGSTALLAEAGHSLADTTNQVLLLVSLSLGRRKPDEEHPYGHGKDRFFWAALAAVGMFVGGAIFAVWLGISRLLGGGEHEGGYLIAYVVLAFSLAVETVALVRAYRHTRAEARHHRRSLLQEIRETKDVTVKVVLFEDSVAVAGVLIAFAGLGLAQLTGVGALDAIASILIGLLLMTTAVVLARDARGLLIGEAAHVNDRKAIRRAILDHDGVEELLELLTMQLGPESILVTARINLRTGMPSSEFERLSNEIDAAIRQAVPPVTEVFLDATPGHARDSGALPDRRRASSRS